MCMRLLDHISPEQNVYRAFSYTVAVFESNNFASPMSLIADNYNLGLYSGPSPSNLTFVPVGPTEHCPKLMVSLQNPLLLRIYS